MPVTQKEIARRLGISIAAVSRALDGYPDISEETRQAVVDIANELGYVRNRAALQLRHQKTNVIGYILPADQPRFFDPFFAEFIAGLGDECARHGYDLLLTSVTPDSGDEQRSYRDWVNGQRIDGLVLNRLRLNDWRVRFLQEQHLPFVGLEVDGTADPYPAVTVQNRAGMRRLVQHLITQGYRQIAYLDGPAGLKIQSDRLAGFIEGMQAAGIRLHPEWVLQGDLTAATAENLANELLAQPKRPDAFVCINDQSAFGVYRCAARLGLQVGPDLGVAGFDGVITSATVMPPLTSMNQNVYEIARKLTCKLVSILAGETVDPLVEQVDLELLPRRSTERHVLQTLTGGETRCVD